MKTLRELYRIGYGPSSSHTIAPNRAATLFRQENPDAEQFRVTLYGSLAATGKGHLTDVAIRKALHPHTVDIVWEPSSELPLYPNGMRFEAMDGGGNVLSVKDDYSLGGGSLFSDSESPDIYPLKTLSAILKDCEARGEKFQDFVFRFEPDIRSWLEDIWMGMCRSIEKGLREDGVLPGGLGLSRKAGLFFRKSAVLKAAARSEALLSAYAFAVSEENAGFGRIVTAPTCGSSGVVPAVIYHLKDELGCTAGDIVNALATAGLIGNVVKTNASVSGAVVGCQGEIGTACAMAAAAAAQLMGGTLNQIEYAAEMGLEHHLGLTCDPVYGLVQIPCIERNAHAAMRAVSCARFSMLSEGVHLISFDDVVEVLLETGRALPASYKETSTGGLARVYEKRICGAG